MIGRTLRLGVVLLVGLGLVTACSSDRPHELSMDAVSPCGLFTESTREQLDVSTQPRSSDVVSGAGVQGRTCFYVVRPGNQVMVSTVTNHGIDRWTDGSFEHTKFKDVRSIRGYRTIRTWNIREHLTPDQTCTLYIDVADGQSLRVRVGQSFDEKDPPTCETARRFADATLKAVAASQS